MKHARSIQSGAWRSRWAAIGAAVAVTLGAGGMVAVNAASSAPSSFVSIEPTRVLDTRTNVGLPGPFFSGVSQKLRVTGEVATQPPGDLPPVDQTVVPTTATAVTLNVTVVRPETRGFLSIRPGDATGNPATSNINFGPDSPNTANSVTVALPASGLLDIFVNGTVGEVLIDIAGYFEPAASGPPGPKGDPGPSIGGVDFVDGVGVVNLDDTAQIIQQISITAPESGTAIVTATFQANLPGGAGMRCAVTLDPTDLSAETFLTNGDTQRYLPFARTRGFDVDAGTTIVYLVCTGNPAVMGVTQAIFAHNMTAVYSPNRV